jgi:hypothetical protein
MEMQASGVCAAAVLLLSMCLIFSAQAARTEPQQLLGETQQLLGDERPILQVCNLFGIAGDIPSHEDTGILVQ